MLGFLLIIKPIFLPPVSNTYSISLKVNLDDQNNIISIRTRLFGFVNNIPLFMIPSRIMFKAILHGAADIASPSLSLGDTKHSYLHKIKCVNTFQFSTSLRTD